jgi:ADP-ribose pyrophosphatase YjhB (NUDIX family)
MDLTFDWNKFEKGVFLVNVLGIVYNPKTKKILIGRRENDPYIMKLSWCFPGGTAGYEGDLELYVRDEIRAKTRLEVEVKNIVFAKTYPENREFLSIYYHCEPTAGRAIAGGAFKEIKWVKPTNVRRYFTTSLHGKVFDYLKNLG